MFVFLRGVAIIIQRFFCWSLCQIYTFCFLAGPIAIASEPCAKITHHYGRTPVIVDGASGGKELGRALARRGIKPAHLKSSNGKWGSLFSHSYDSNQWERNFTNHFDNDFDSLAKHMEQANPSVFLPGAETGVEVANALNKKFGFDDFILNYEPRDKFEVNQILSRPIVDEDGILRTLRTPREIKSSNREELIAFAAREIELSQRRFSQSHKNQDSKKGPPGRVVIKPSKGGGSYGVTTCFSVAEAIEAIDRILGKKNHYHLVDNEVIVTEFLPGREWVVDLVCWQRQCVVAEFLIYNKFQMDHGPMFYHWDEILPLSDLQHPVVQHAVRSMRRLGNPSGLFHIEIMWEGLRDTKQSLDEIQYLNLPWDNSEIKNQVIEPVVVEVNHRGRGGIGSSKVFRKLAGYNEYDLLADLIANPSNPQLFKSRIGKGYELNGYGFLITINTPTEGLIVAHPSKWLQHLQKFDPISFSEENWRDNISLSFEPGESSPYTNSLGTAWGEVAVVIQDGDFNASREKAIQFTRYIKECEANRIFWTD